MDDTVLNLVTNCSVIAFKELCFLLFTILSFKSDFEVLRCCGKNSPFLSYTRVQIDETYLHVRKYLPSDRNFLSEGRYFWPFHRNNVYSCGMALPPYSCTRIPAKLVFPVQQVSRCRNISVTWAITWVWWPIRRLVGPKLFVRFLVDWQKCLQVQNGFKSLSR